MRDFRSAAPKGRIDVPGTLALTGFVICWSITPVLLKGFTTFIDGWIANGMRYPASALLFVPWLLVLKKQNRLHPGLWRLALVPALINTVSQILWAWSPYFIDAGMMGFIIRLSTVWAVTGAFFMFRDERKLMRSVSFWAGLLCALGGFAGLSLLGRSSLYKSTAAGLALILTCSVFWAGYQLSVRKQLSRIPSHTAFGAVACLTSIPLLMSMVVFSRPGRILELNFTQNAVVIASGILGIAIGHVLFYTATKRLGVTISSSVNLIGAFLTALLSRIVFGETLTPHQWVSGAILVLGGILMVRTQTQIHAVNQSKEPRSAQVTLNAE